MWSKRPATASPVSKRGDRVIASLGNGGMQEEVLADPNRCIAMPDGMDFDVASGLILTYGTSHYALKDRAKLKAGENLVVLGAAGGVGLAAVELGKAMGARVVAGASSQEKVDLAKRHGADDGFVYPSGKLSRDQQKELSEEIKRLTGGKGADVLYDPVGGDYSEPAIRAMNWEGRFLVIGFAAGDIPRIPLNLTLLKSCDILGVFWGAFTMRDPKRNQEHLAELVRWCVEGKIKPLCLGTLSPGARGRGHPHARRPQGPGQSRRDHGMTRGKEDAAVDPPARAFHRTAESARAGADHRRGGRRSERHRHL